MEPQGTVTGTRSADEVRDEYVDPAEFLDQMTSRRRLLRCDENGATIRGLLDPETGQRILIEENRLFNDS